VCFTSHERENSDGDKTAPRNFTACDLSLFSGPAENEDKNEELFVLEAAQFQGLKFVFINLWSFQFKSNK